MEKFTFAFDVHVSVTANSYEEAEQLVMNATPNLPDGMEIVWLEQVEMPVEDN
jgi:hypothetical protein